MKKTLYIAAILLLGMAATGCERTLEDGVITLRQENLASSTGEKVYIDASNLSHWETGDQVNVNGGSMEVNVSGGAASLSNVGGNENIRIVYPRSICTSSAIASASSVSVNLPRKYTYQTNAAGQQVVQLPMAGTAAYADAVSKGVYMKHLTGALKVVVKNSFASSPMRLDSIVIISNQYRQNGPMTLNLETAELGTPENLGSSTNPAKSIVMSFEGTWPRIEPGEELAVWIPVAPAGNKNRWQVEVYAPTTGKGNNLVARYRRLQNNTHSFGRNMAAVVNIPFGADAYTGTPTKIFQGSGTDASPILINTLRDLVMLSDTTLYNFYGSNAMARRTISIGADIDGKGYTINTIGAQEVNSYKMFRGKLLGNGHTIKNLNITGGGLFGTITQATVKDLTLENVVVSADSNYRWVGLICPRCHTSATIENITARNCTVKQSKPASNTGLICGWLSSGTDGSISGCTLSGCTLEVNLGGGNNCIGSITGVINQNSTISGCTVDAASRMTVNRTANNTYVGGLVGRLDAGSISNCSSAIVGTVSSVANRESLFVGLKTCAVRRTNSSPQLTGSSSTASIRVDGTAATADISWDER